MRPVWLAIAGLGPVLCAGAVLAADEATPPPAVQQVSPPPAAAMPDIDPIALYGSEAVFDVYRRGKKVGEHRVTFARDGERLSVAVRLDIAVDFLFIRNAYRFTYELTEIWNGKRLEALTARVNDNGREKVVSAGIRDGLFRVEGSAGPEVASAWVFPTNHWNRGQLAVSTLLNTLTGRFITVEIVRRGIDTVQTEQGPVAAEHFEYTGQLRNTDVWYDAEDRWVGLRFKAKDGSMIEYVCRQCGLSPQTAEGPGFR